MNFFELGLMSCETSIKTILKNRTYFFAFSVSIFEKRKIKQRIRKLFLDFSKTNLDNEKIKTKKEKRFNQLLSGGFLRNSIRNGDKVCGRGKTKKGASFNLAPFLVRLSVYYFTINFAVLTALFVIN